MYTYEVFACLSVRVSAVSSAAMASIRVDLRSKATDFPFRCFVFTVVATVAAFTLQLAVAAAVADGTLPRPATSVNTTPPRRRRTVASGRHGAGGGGQLKRTELLPPEPPKKKKKKAVAAAAGKVCDVTGEHTPFACRLTEVAVAATAEPLRRASRVRMRSHITPHRRAIAAAVAAAATAAASLLTVDLKSEDRRANERTSTHTEVLNSGSQEAVRIAIGAAIATLR